MKKIEWRFKGETEWKKFTPAEPIMGVEGYSGATHILFLLFHAGAIPKEIELRGVE